MNSSTIEYLLNRRRRLVIESSDLVHSAVLVPLYVNDSDPYVLLTKRTSHVEHHKGEISFPGGGRSSEDKDLADTALRETEEEVGLRRELIHVLGPLDDIATVTGFRITPFVGTFPFPFEYKINEFEIERILEVPLKSLAVEGAWKETEKVYKGARIKSFYHKLGDDMIWGATASILKSFVELMQADGML